MKKSVNESQIKAISKIRGNKSNYCRNVERRYVMLIGYTKVARNECVCHDGFSYGA